MASRFSTLIAIGFCGALCAQNLLLDPGMENKDTAAWTLQDAEFSEESALVGRVACAIKPGIKDAGIRQTVTLEKDVQYIALAWINMGVWGETGYFEVKVDDGNTISQAITHKGWSLYGIPFTATQAQATVGLRMDDNTGGAWCDMFALAKFENYLAEPSVEDNGAEVTELGGWIWGAWASEDYPRTGAIAWTSDHSGGGGWGFYPPFDANNIIIAGAWIKTGDNDLYEPGFIDLATSSNMGWWAVRTKEHVSEINIVYSDIEYYQYVIPYKVPANATSPEILWWQSWGQSPSYCDDLFLIMSPYTDEQVPWEFIKSDPDGNWGFWSNPEDADWPITPGAAVRHAKTAAAQTFALRQNYPNPFNSATEITFILDRTENAQLSIYSLSGERVAVLLDGLQTAGEHSVQFDASGLASGIYLCRLQTSASVSVKKMVLTQ